jgi:hypothetical protein
MKEIPIFLVIIISICACRSTNNDGFKLVFECEIPSEYIVEFNEDDFSEIDWDNQEFHLVDTMIESVEFNNRICFGRCKLNALVNGHKFYEAILYCNMGSNNFATKRNNVIYIEYGKDSLNIMYNNKLQLNLNDKRMLTEDPEIHREISSFLFNEPIRQYLLKQSLIQG